MASWESVPSAPGGGGGECEEELAERLSPCKDPLNVNSDATFEEESKDHIWKTEQAEGNSSFQHRHGLVGGPASQRCMNIKVLLESVL